MPFTSLNDPSHPGTAPIPGKSARTIAHILLAILFLAWPRDAGCFEIGSPALVAIVLPVLLIWSIESRQWILLGAVAAVVGFNVLTSTAGRRSPSNESAAVANLRTINTAQVTYLSSSDGIYGTMSDLIDARLLDDTFSGTKAGYNYMITVDAVGYTAIALPATTETGRYGYYSVPDAVVRYATNASLAPAGQAGKSVQQ